MKKFYYHSIIFILSCKENKNFDIELKAITADFTHWWQYFNSDIDLSSDFITIHLQIK
jgi:hypothetical protein